MGQALWEAHIEAWRARGETQAAYCRRVGVSQITFSGWNRRFERQALGGGAGDGGAAVLAVGLSEPAAEAGPESTADITVGIGERIGIPTASLAVSRRRADTTNPHNIPPWGPNSSATAIERPFAPCGGRRARNRA